MDGWLKYENVFRKLKTEINGRLLAIEVIKIFCNSEAFCIAPRVFTECTLYYYIRIIHSQIAVTIKVSNEMNMQVIGRFTEAAR